MLFDQVKTTPMYKDASTEEYITTLVLPVVTDKVGNLLNQDSQNVHHQVSRHRMDYIFQGQGAWIFELSWDNDKCKISTVPGKI